MTIPRHYRSRLPIRTLQVPLFTPGDEHVGFFRAPAAAVEYKPHSNEILKLGRVVTEKVKVWVSWKGKEGWKMVGKPTVLAPVRPSATPDGQPLDDGDVRFYVRATFVRTEPLYISLEDFLATKDDADRYGVSIEQGRSFETPLPAVKTFIGDADVPGDAMQQAEERRRLFGLRRTVELDADGVVVGRVEPDPNAATRGTKTVT